MFYPTHYNLQLKIEHLFIKGFIKFGNAVLDLVRFFLFKRTSDPPRCIIVFRAGAFGDFIVALPALRLLRKQYPRAKIVLLTVPSLHPRWRNKNIVSGGLAFGQDFLDETLFIPVLNRENWRQFKYIRKRILQLNPDICVVLPFAGEPFVSRIVKMILIWLLGCRKNLYGYHANSNLVFFRAVQHKLGMFEHQVMAPMAALKGLGISSDEVIFEVSIPPDDVETVDAWWKQHGLDDDSLLCIAISPFAKQKLKCWPIENFRELGYALLSRFPNVRVVIVGGQEDELLGDFLVKVWGRRSVNFAGKSSLLQSAEIIRRCKLFIGNDSGPSHLAAAVEVPVITIFSSFVFPELWEPWGERNIVVRRSVPCEFCFTEDGKCPKGTNACLDKISVNEVLSHCQAVLEDGQALARDSSRVVNTL